MTFNIIPEDTLTKIKKVTRIEIRYGKKSKSLTLEEHTNAEVLSDYIKNKLSEITESTTMTMPITDSPVKHIDKCMVQVYEATNQSVSRKVNFKSFTCYGIDDERASHLIKLILKNS